MNDYAKKSRGLKIALVVVSILLIASFGANLYFYTTHSITVSRLTTERDVLNQQINDLTTERDNLEDQVNSLITERESLKQQIKDLVNERDPLKSQIVSLQNQITDLEDEVNRLKSPKLVTTLSVTDQRPWFQTPYLQISGEVWNVGSDTAYGCRLHVILYQGSAIAEDTYISLGTINGESYRNVDSKIFYAGSELTDIDIIPQMD